MAPSRLLLEPVGECDVGCLLCPARPGSSGAKALMPWALYCDLLDRFAGTDELRLDGQGEPFLHPRVFDMIARAARLGMRVSASSNCAFLTPSRAERLLSCGLEVLDASIDGATRGVFETLRPGARLKAVLKGLRLLARAKRRSGGVRPQVRVCAVAARDNLQELPAIVRLARRLEASAVVLGRILPFRARNRASEDYLRAQSLEFEDPDRVSTYLGRAREAAEDCGIELVLPEPKPGCPGAFLDYRGRPSCACGRCLAADAGSFHFAGR